MNNPTPLRYPVVQIKDLLSKQNPYVSLFALSRESYTCKEDLLLMKDKSFERAEDFLQEVRKVITFIKNDMRTIQDWNNRTSACFVFVYQKIDEFYMKSSQEFQALFEKEAWEDSDYIKEKRIKSILRDLLKCELTIEEISQQTKDGYSPNLYSQLEIIFDDCELLDILFLAISNQISDCGEDNEPLRLKGLYFIFPFLKLFYGQKGDIMDFFKDHQDFLKKSEAVEEVYKDIKTLLRQYTDLNESEILRFCEEIKSTRLRQIVTKEKHRFKEEKGYYEMLGNLSLLLFLWKQEAAESEIFLPLLRIGFVGFVYYLDAWRNIKHGIGRDTFEYYWKLKKLDFKEKIDLPVKILKYTLDEVKKRDLNEEYLRLLELSFSVFNCLVKLTLDHFYAPGIRDASEGYIDCCLLSSEGAKSFIGHDFYEFLDSKVTSLSEMQSSYMIESSLSKNLTAGWFKLFKALESCPAIMAYSNEGWVYQAKYLSPVKILMRDLIEFITSEKSHFFTLSESLQESMVFMCSSLFLERNLFKTSDIEEVYLSVQNVGLAVLEDLKKEVLTEKKIISRFRSLIKLSGMLIMKWKSVYRVDNTEEDLIKKVYESKLIEEFIVAYEENKSLLQKSGDVNVIEAFFELMEFITNFFSEDSSFLSKERNLNFLKLVFQDSCEINMRLVNRQPYESFSCAITYSFRQTEFVDFMKILKDEKLLFGLWRIYVLGPYIYSAEANCFLESFCKAFSQDQKTFFQLFGKFLEVFETKMRNPSLDFENALKQFENGIENEKNKAIEEGTSLAYSTNKEAPILKEKVFLNSLGLFAGGYCRRISALVWKIGSTFTSDMEQVKAVTKKFARMMVDPLIVFAYHPSFFRGFKTSLKELVETNNELFIPICEGTFAGIVDICNEFKFNEYSVISKLDAKRLCKMISKISAIEYLRKDDIPEDFTYQEAALMSLIIGVKFFNSCFGNSYQNPAEDCEGLERGFKEATILIDQVQNNILKCISMEIVNERNGQDIEAFIKDCKPILEEGCFSLNMWTGIFDTFYQADKLKAAAEETYKTIFERFDPFDVHPNGGQEEKIILAGLIYNSLRLKEFEQGYDFILDRLWILRTTSPEGLQPLLNFELYLLECADYYSKDLVKPLIGYLTSCFRRSLLNKEAQIKEKCFGKDGKVLFQIIRDFLKKLAIREATQRNCKKLMFENLYTMFEFFGSLYKIYSNYIKEKISSIDSEIEEEGALEEKKEGEVELEKLKQERAKLIESYKNEIQKYIDAIIQCQQHYMVDLRELFALGEEFGGVVQREYWTELFKQAHGSLALYVKNVLQKSDNEIKLKDVSKYKSINQIYQIRFLYHCLMQHSIKEMVNELSLGKDLIEDLLMVVNQTLGGLVSEDLTLFAKEKECLDFPDILDGFISSIIKLAINYIVSQVLENNGNDRFLLVCLDLAENVFSVQQSILHGMRQDLFSVSYSTCYKDTVCLMNAILRAKKSLRVEFMNKGLLKKILTVDGLSVSDDDEISSILFLMMTLLEDSEPKNSSPVAVQTLLKSLIENFAFEKTSMASLEKVKEKEKSKKIENVKKRRIFTKGYLFIEESLCEEEESYDPNVYWDESGNRQMIVKDTSALVVVLSGILSNHPHLIPSVIFQEVSSVKDILSHDIMNYFKSNSRWSFYDILMRLILLKDGNSLIFLIASLIEDNVVTTGKEQQSIELRYVLLIRTLEILTDILDCEENQDQAFENLNSVLMRRNIAMIIAFISNQMESLLYKEEILQLMVQITQKLLSNPQMIAYSMQVSEPSNSMLRILSSIIKQNASKLMTREEISSNYPEILKVLKTKGCYEPKVLQRNLTGIFEKNLFIKEELKIEEDQKKFEICEEKSQWRFLEIAGLKEKELISEVRLAAHRGTPLGEDLTLRNILSENLYLDSLGNLYKSIEIFRESANDLKVDYLLARLKESEALSQIQKERDQTFGSNIDSEIFLPLLKADLTKINKLKEVKDQNSEECPLQEVHSDQNIANKTQDILLENQEQNPQEVQVEDSSNPVALPDEEEEKINQDDEKTFKYFMDITVKSEANFKFRVNKALKYGRRLKEMICLEKTLKGSDEKKSEEMILEFTSGMTEFDKNVVYASLGKKFEGGLSEEFRKMIKEARKELETIQQDFSQYEEAKNKISKVEEQEENREEDEEYEDLDYDIQFLAEEEEEKKPEDENKREEAEDAEEKEDENYELVAESAPTAAENKNEKIVSLINSFEVSDSFIMDALELFFCYINPNSGNQSLVVEFLKDSLSLNPINELKILDVMITILYTPEFFEDLKRKFAESYEKAVEKILTYLSECFEDASRSYIFFVPKGYLEKFGVTVLKGVKETTGFAQKISDCHTLLDMLLGLIEMPSFCNNEKWLLRILDGVISLVIKEKKIRLIENVPQASLDQYRKIISCRKLLNLFNLIEKSTNQVSSEARIKVQEIFMNLKSIPELFVPFQDHLSNHFYQTILRMNKELESCIRLFKQNQDKELEETEIRDILASINSSQFQLIVIIMFSFASVFQDNLFSKQGKNPKIFKKLRTLLRTVTESLFNEEEVKAFFVNIHELADLLNKIKKQDSFNELFNHLLMICIGHYSIIIMEGSVEEESAGLRKQSEGNSQSDDEQTTALAKLVSFEDPETLMIPIQKSYSYYRREVNVDFGAIFANFALKHSTRVSKLLTLQMTGIDAVLSNLLSIIIPKFPWIIDFKSKMGVFETQVRELLENNGAYSDDRRGIQIDRKNFVFSAMKEFKDLPRKDLLQFLHISYANESGIDGGGLRRDFYEMITRQLFDPSVGLFKLTGNQSSIQPNPLSGMIPYDSTLMQFAGLILAKAICDKMVVDLNFTKPFLKHILDMEGVDTELGKNLRWILENNVEELYLNFTHEIEGLGERTVIELKEGGADLIVEEENKKEYVKQICEYRMTKQIERQLKDFLKGFRMILPKEFISHFTTSELEILIAGESKIDLEEMKKHAILRDYSKTDHVILWLWEVLEEFSPDQLTAFYYFTSGSTKVPFGGFKDNPISVSSHSNKDGLPVAHTCFYTIEIPNYDSKDKLREKLLLAIFDGAGEFQIA